jgi:hypothetical protein
MSPKKKATEELVAQTAKAMAQINASLRATAEAIDRRVEQMRAKVEHPRRRSRELQAVPR